MDLPCSRACCSRRSASGCLDAGPTPLGRHLVTGRAPEQVQLVDGAVGAPSRILLLRRSPAVNQFRFRPRRSRPSTIPGPAAAPAEPRVIVDHSEPASPTARRPSARRRSTAPDASTCFARPQSRFSAQGSEAWSNRHSSASIPRRASSTTSGPQTFPSPPRTARASSSSPGRRRRPARRPPSQAPFVVVDLRRHDDDVPRGTSPSSRATISTSHRRAPALAAPPREPHPRGPRRRHRRLHRPVPTARGPCSSAPTFVDPMPTGRAADLVLRRDDPHEDRCRRMTAMARIRALAERPLRRDASARPWT